MILSVSQYFLDKQLHLFLQIATPGMNSPMTSITPPSQHTTIVSPTSGSAVPRKRGGCPYRKIKFHGNQYTDREGMSPTPDETFGTLPFQLER